VTGPVSAVKKSEWSRLAVLFAPALVLLTPFVSFLKFQGYPLFTVEVGYLAGFIVVLSLVLSCIIKWGGRLGAALIVAAALTCFADFQFEVRITYLAVGCVVLVGLGLFLARPLMPILAVVFGVVLLSTLILPAQLRDAGLPLASDKDIRRDLPPILHIILDEQIGIEGIEQTTTWEKRARADLKAFYLENGFRLYGGAYSNYTETFNSIPNLLNNTLSSKSWAYVENGSDGLSAVTENAYLRGYAQRGYGIRIYQSKYFNFCEAPSLALLSCKSYNYTGLNNLDALTDEAAVRAKLILARFLNRSRIYGLGRSVYQGLATRGFLNLGRIENNNFAPLASYPFFGILQNDLAKGPGGQVFFAHLLIPHRPFMFGANCDLVLDHAYDHLERRSPEWLVEYRKAYFEQVACTTKLMSELFERLKKAGVYDSMTIVVHGDHGSRIGPVSPKVDTWPSFDLPMLRAQYSTLFAIKAPGIDAGYDDRLFSLGGLVNSVAGRSGNAFDPSPDVEHVVFLEGKKGALLEKRRLRDFRIPGSGPSAESVK
jgi:hypothetical protein